MLQPSLEEISLAERESILRAFFKEGSDGPLHTYPSQNKKKLVVLANLAGMFDRHKTYREREVNLRLQSRFDDFATLRRDLVEFGFFRRNTDCREYRRVV
ncbi:DUF2087 domain-containing protein [bacterium]|nr:DUF2087 domain-containing protein [bacterium]MBU1983129.1 DUF2087 domain-containing protein [bacterium]